MSYKTVTESSSLICKPWVNEIGQTINPGDDVIVFKIAQ